jgi:hypothetical protein
MSVFRPFECEVLRILAPSALSPEQIEAIIVSSELVSYEHSGVGYFLTVKHASLPEKRVVCDEPMVVGDAAGDVQCCFILFIENSELMLECVTVGQVDVPEGIRDMAVLVRTYVG